jgi:hypothetical protein
MDIANKDEADIWAEEPTIPKSFDSMVAALEEAEARIDPTTKLHGENIPEPASKKPRLDGRAGRMSTKEGGLIWQLKSVNRWARIGGGGGGSSLWQWLQWTVWWKRDRIQGVPWKLLMSNLNV